MLPIEDTADLRSGAPLHDALLALLPLVGVWDGGGSGRNAVNGVEFAYRQRISITHDGRPFLAYDARSWLVDDTGAVLRLAWRESGFWRPGPDEDAVELVVASNTGQALVLAGTAGDGQWELATVVAAHTPTAVDVDGERRFYAVRSGTEGAAELLYATELAPAGQPFAPHLNARLTRLVTAAA